MSRLAKLSLATTVLTFLAVTAGGLVRATGSGGATYRLLLRGSYVTGRDAGLAFKDWPLMDGRPVPPHLDQIQRLLQFSHRIVAALVAVLVAYVVVRAWREGGPTVRRLAVV